MPREIGSASDPGPRKRVIRLKINGAEYQVSVEPRRTLLDVLRQDLGLTGSKKGCNEGTCGTCTVLAEGRPIYSCLALAVEMEGRSIETIEGLSREGRLHPVQRAFLEEDALQCGFCTPGQILSLKALLDRRPSPTPEEIARSISGNLCRCGAYPKIFKAAIKAAGWLRSGR